MTEHPPYVNSHRRAMPSAAPGLVTCQTCSGKGVVSEYSVYRAARRAPPATKPCPACQGLRRSLPAEPMASSWGWQAVGLLILAVTALIGLF